jgi:hypothetical protein
MQVRYRDLGILRSNILMCNPFVSEYVIAVVDPINLNRTSVLNQGFDYDIKRPLPIFPFPLSQLLRVPPPPHTPPPHRRVAFFDILRANPYGAKPAPQAHAASGMGRRCLYELLPQV